MATGQTGGGQTGQPPKPTPKKPGGQTGPKPGNKPGAKGNAAGKKKTPKAQQNPTGAPTGGGGGTGNPTPPPPPPPQNQTWGQRIRQAPGGCWTRFVSLGKVAFVIALAVLIGCCFLSFFAFDVVTQANSRIAATSVALATSVPTEIAPAVSTRRPSGSEGTPEVITLVITVTPEMSPTPTLDLTKIAQCGESDPDVKVGHYAAVSNVSEEKLERFQVFDQLNENKRPLGSVFPPNTVEVLDGPQCYNGATWFKIHSVTMNLTGWMQGFPSSGESRVLIPAGPIQNVTPTLTLAAPNAATAIPQPQTLSEERTTVCADAPASLIAPAFKKGYKQARSTNNGSGRINVRSNFSAKAEILTDKSTAKPLQVLEGESFQIVFGPMCSPKGEKPYVWWQIVYKNYKGWIIEGTGTGFKEQFIEPVWTGIQPTLSTDADLADTPASSTVCPPQPPNPTPTPTGMWYYPVALGSPTQPIGSSVYIKPGMNLIYLRSCPDNTDRRRDNVMGTLNPEHYYSSFQFLNGWIEIDTSLGRGWTKVDAKYLDQVSRAK